MFLAAFGNGFTVSRGAVAGGVGRLAGAPVLPDAGRRRPAGAWSAVVLAAALAAAVSLGGVVGEQGPVRAAGGSRTAVAPLGLQAVAQRAIGASARDYWVRRRGGALIASGAGVVSRFGPGGVRVSVPGGVVGLRLAGVGYGAGVAGVRRAVAPVAAGAVVRYRRGGVVEWYRNGPFGLEQGFTLARRVDGAGSGPLTLAIAVDGSLVARRAHGGVVFVSRSGAVRLRYGALRVIDAAGRRLPATLALSDGRVLVRVSDRGARYPIIVDPFIQTGTKLVNNCTSGCSGPNGTGAAGAGGFGTSVAVSGDGNTALIGAYNDNLNPTTGPAGAVWVFTRTDGVWSQQGPKLVGNCTSNCTGPNGSGETSPTGFGGSVALSDDGNTALIGSLLDSTAWVFTRTGGAWSQQGATLVGDSMVPDQACQSTLPILALPQHDVALSADGNTALIGGPCDNGQQGAAWVFTRTGVTWSQQGAKLVAGTCPSFCSGANTGENGAGLFGWSVALSGDGNTALIGGPGDTGADPNGDAGTGAAWMFTRTGSVWSQQGPKVVASCPADSGVCGATLGTGEISTGFFGSSVALSGDGNTALIGGPRDEVAAPASSAPGAAWVFTRTGGDWSQQGTKLIGDCTSGCSGPNGTGEVAPTTGALTGTGGDLGASVTLSGDGNTALIGAPYDQDTNDGSVWVFTRTGGGWSQQGTKLVGNCTANCSGPNGTGEVDAGTPFGVIGGHLGADVALSRDGVTALLGAPLDNTTQGAAWVFAITRSLTVALTGAGAGNVTGAGINCPGICSTSRPLGSTVTLTATPAAGSTFTGWSGGGCSGTASCQLPLDADTTVTATFVPAATLSVSLTGSGSGTVTGVGINCPGICSASLPAGSAVTLTATPAAASTFTAWSGGGCSGSGSCSLTANSNTRVTATFTKTPRCALTITSRKVLVARPKTKHGHRSKASVGTLPVRVVCDQAATVKLTGKLTEYLGKKPKHGKQKAKVFKLGPVRGSTRALASKTLLIKLPRAALSGLKRKAREAVALNLTANSGASASANIARLVAIR